MAFTCNIQSVVHCGKFQHEAKMYLSKQQQSTQTGCSHYCRLFSIWTIRKTHDFQAYFSRTFQDLKKSFNFQNFPGSKWFYRTFQVLEFSGKKFQDFTGGVRTLQNASACKLLFPAYIFQCPFNPKIRNLHLCHTMHRWRKIDEPDRQWRSSSFQESKKVCISCDLWPWSWAHPRCTLTWSPSWASLVAIRPFAGEKKRFSFQHKSARITWPLT